MIKICLANVSLIKGIFESLKDVAQEGTWHFNEDRILIQEMDVNHISLCSITLHSGDLIYYECQNNISLSFSFKNVYKILSYIESDSSVKIIYEHSTDFLLFILEGKGKEVNFVLKLINIRHEMYHFATYAIYCKIVINSKEFKKIITEMNHIGDNCTIKASENNVSFVSTGEIGTYDVTLNKSKDCYIECNKHVELIFNSSFLLNFSKNTSLVDFVTICLTKNTPIIVEYEISPHSNIKYYLSPNI